MAINPKIKERAEKIRKEVYGKDVREALASGLEVMSEDVEETKNRQDNVESQFQNVESQFQAVLDETTRKDVISAPEVIAARVGADGTNHANLKERLDQEHQEVTAQLAKNAKGIYIIDNKKWGISNNGTNPVETLKGIQNAINDAKARGYNHIKLSAGTYLVRVGTDGTSRIKLPSNTRFTLDDNAVVKAESTDAPVYTIFEFQLVENVILEGGTVEGDRDTHTYTGGEYQSLIHVWASKNITIRDMKIRNSPCLGIRVRENFSNGIPSYSENVRIYNNEIYNINQCGIVAEGVQGLWVYNNSIHDVYGLSIETGLDIEGPMISEAYIYNNDFYNNGKVDLLVYIPSVTPTVHAENLFISNNRCTTKIWVECDNINTPIHVEGNTVNNMGTSGDIPTVDFAFYVRGKGIRVSNNTIYGRTMFFKMYNSTVDNLFVSGESLQVSECENSTFRNIEFHATVDEYKNFHVRRNTNVKFYGLILEQIQGVFEDKNTGLYLENVEVFNLSKNAFQIYSLGTAEGIADIIFKDLYIHSKKPNSTTGILSISTYCNVLIDGLTTKNIQASNTADIYIGNNSILKVVGGYVEDCNRLIRTDGNSINRKLYLQGLFIDKKDTVGTNLIDVGGETELIVTNCTFKCEQSMQGIKSDLATTNAIISQNTFIKCTNTTKPEDILSNNTVT